MDWNVAYAAEYTPWEKGKAHPELVRLAKTGLLDAWEDKVVIVPGCGLGHDVKVLNDHGAKAFGVDISPLAVERAKETYQGIDVREMDVFSGAITSVDGVFEHTCFCAINPSLRSKYVQTVASMLAPGGLLMGIFFINPDYGDDDRDGPPFASAVDEIYERFEEFFEIQDCFIPEQTYSGREGRERWMLMRRKG